MSGEQMSAGGEALRRVEILEKRQAESMVDVASIELKREALRKPFEEKDVERTFTEDRTVNGKKYFGTRKGYDTTGIKYQAVVDRLNDVLGIAGWRTSATFEVEMYKTQKGRDMYAVTCAVRLQIGAPFGVKAFQVLAEREGTGGHDSSTLADGKKGAYTNGLKKTAAMFGVGREAYADEIDDDNKPKPKSEPTKPEAGAGRTSGSQSGSSEKPRPPIGNENETESRLAYLRTLFGLADFDKIVRAAKDSADSVAKLHAVKASAADVKYFHALADKAGVDPDERLLELKEKYRRENPAALLRWQLLEACVTLKARAA